MALTTIAKSRSSLFDSSAEDTGYVDKEQQSHMRKLKIAITCFKR